MKKPSSEPAPASTPASRIPGTRVLRLAAVSPTGELRVEVPDHGAVAARSLRDVVPPALRRDELVGREALVCFDGEDPARPVIVGLLDDPMERLLEHLPPDEAATEARVDGSRVVLEGREEVSLVCGEASITLHRDGRVAIRGVNVTSEAGELQRIRGAVVKIN